MFKKPTKLKMFYTEFFSLIYIFNRIVLHNFKHNLCCYWPASNINRAKKQKWNRLELNVHQLSEVDFWLVCLQILIMFQQTLTTTT